MGESGILLPGEQVELIDGEIIQVTPQGPPHLGTVAHLMALFFRGIGDRANVYPQLPVRLGDRSLPEPDLALLKVRSNFYKDAYPREGDVLLVVEVADTSLRSDRMVKLRLYARFGIAEYWIINIPEGCFEVYRTPDGSGYQEFRRYVPGEQVAPQAFPDLIIEVATLLGS